MEETKKEKNAVNKQKTELNISGLGISSFLLSLISIEALFMGVCINQPFIFGIFALPAAVLAVAFGVFDRKIQKSTIPLVGLVLGLIVLALYVVYFFTILVLGVENFNLY